MTHSVSLPGSGFIRGLQGCTIGAHVFTYSDANTVLNKLSSIYVVFQSYRITIETPVYLH